MNILVLNGGSSSIKFSLFAASNPAAEPKLTLDGELTGMGSGNTTLSLKRGEQAEERSTVQAEDPSAALGLIFDTLTKADAGHIDAVGHRVVHPGAELHDHTRITDNVLAQLQAAASFAPLHDPEAITIIREAQKRTHGVPHFACFDTVFHQTMPAEASTYAIPQKFREQGVKRYGFHGLSCESVIRELRHEGPLPERMVIAHLGSGCSVTALRHGESIDTTMGLTPTGGILMGTRPGDLDPGLLLYLLRQSDSVEAVEKMLNHDAGMVALTGLPNDMKAVRKAAADGNTQAALALKAFTRSVQKAIGSYAWLLGGLDTLVFTGGIGEHDPASRAEVLAGTGVLLDAESNQAKAGGVRRISATASATAVYAVPAQEDLVIALHVKRMAGHDAQQHPSHV